MADVFDLILHSNLFNFAIFMLIIIAICYFVDVGAVLDKMKEKVVSEIDNSKKTKQQAIDALNEANYEYSKLPNELEVIAQNANQKSESLSKQIMSDTEQKISNIEKNTRNILNAEQKHIISGLVSKLGLKSVEAAKEDIINELKNNPQLHYKFIEESISKLDEVVL